MPFRVAEAAALRRMNNRTRGQACLPRSEKGCGAATRAGSIVD
jgi:hypothetical protein